MTTRKKKTTEKTVKLRVLSIRDDSTAFAVGAHDGKAIRCLIPDAQIDDAEQVIIPEADLGKYLCGQELRGMLEEMFSGFLDVFEEALHQTGVWEISETLERVDFVASLGSRKLFEYLRQGLKNKEK